MANITLGGNPINTVGDLPKIGEQAKDFKLAKADFSITTLTDYKGSKLILNVFPSIETGTCSASVRRFNKEASELENTKVLCISRDLPLALSRYCGAEGLEDVITLSDFATGEFGKNYGLEMASGGWKSLHSRAIIIIDKEGKITYTQQVPEIADEPNYEEVLSKL